MNDERKTKKQLIAELNELRGRLAGQRESPAGIEGGTDAPPGGDNGFKVLFDNIPAIAFVIDSEHRLIASNREFERVVGNQIGVKTLDLKGISRATREFWHKIEKQVINGGSPAFYVEMVPSPSRGTVYYENRLQPVKGPDGRVEIVVGIAQDITEYVNTEGSLRKSEHRLKALTENAVDIIAITGSDNRINYVSPSVARVVGYTVEELLGETWESYLHPGDISRLKAIAERLVGEPGASYYLEKIRVRNKEGRWITLEGTVTNMLHVPGVEGLVGNYTDVTRRRMAEKKLKESEANYRFLIEQLGEGLVIAKDNPVRLVFANQAMAKMLGYTTDELLSLSPEGISDLVHPDYRREFFERFKARISGKGGEDKYEVGGLSKDGSVVWLSVNSILIDYEGEPATLALFTDITKRKEAEEALRESEEKYRGIFENIMDVYYRADLDGNLLLGSPSGARLLGYDSVDELIGKNIAEEFYADPEERDALVGLLEKHGEIKNFQGTLKKKDGTRITTETNSHLIYDASGEPVAVEGIFRDITERKRAERELKKSQEKYHALFHNAQVGMYRTSLDGSRFLEANRKLAENLGYSAEELMEMPVTALWDDARQRRRMLDLLNEKGVLTDFEVTCRTKNGGLKTFLASVKAYPQEGILEGTALDITDRKLAEQELKKSELKYRTIFEHSTDGICVYEMLPGSTETRLVDCNESYAKMTGSSRRELVSREDVRPIQHAQHAREDSWKIKKEIKKGRPYEGTYSWILPDGRENHYEYRAVPVKIGDRIYIYSIDRDITKRKLAEEELHRVNRALRTITECTQAVVRARDEKDLLKSVCRIIVETGGYSMAWAGFIKHNKKKGIEPVAHTGFEGGFPDDLNLTWADTKMGRGPTGRAIREGKPQIIKDVLDDPDYTPWRENAAAGGYRSAIALPLIAEEETLGVLYINSEEPDSFDTEEVDLLMKLAHDLAYGIAAIRAREEAKKARLRLIDYQEQLRSLASEMSLIEERERRRIAIGLHDRIGQTLAVSKIKLGELRESKCSSEEEAGVLEDLERLIEQTIRDTRSLTFELSPPVLYELGFEAAVEWLVSQLKENNKLNCNLEVDRRPMLLDDDVRVLLFQAVRELLLNVVKHAKTKKADVRITRVNSQIKIDIEDKGAGFDVSSLDSLSDGEGGFGLFSIRERFKPFGGQVEIQSRPGKGTKVTVFAPLMNG